MQRTSGYPPSPFGGLNFTPAPADVVVLIGVVFLTFTFQFFSSAALIPALLRLSPAVWTTGAVWQVLTYPLAGVGGASVWILLELLVGFWFGRDAFYRLGRKRFWQVLLVATVSAALIAVATELLRRSTGGGSPQAFSLMQGQRLLMAVFITLFSALNAGATILVFFVLPVRARWFVWITLGVAFIGFLDSKDLAGFLGIATAIAATLLYLRGPRRLKEPWLRFRKWRMERELSRLRQKRRLTVVPGGKGREEADGDGNVYKGPWVN